MTAAANDEPLDFGVDPFDRTFGQLRGPIHWPSLTVQEAASRMSELRDWVSLLVTRFGLEPRTVPPCWARHPAMVEILSALRDHERASYADTAPPTAAVDWLRALRDAQLLLAETGARTQCTVHEHRNQAVPPWAASNPGDLDSAAPQSSS